MSKLGKIIGIASGVLGASTAVAGGVFVADNPDIVKDYIKGNDTYTSQEMTEVKNDYQGIIDNVNKENKVIKAENEEFSLNITILQNDNAENLKEIERLKSVIAENNSKIAQLESDKEDNAGEIASLKAQNSSFAIQVEDLNTEIKLNNSKIADLTEMVSLLKIGVNNLYDFIEGFSGSLVSYKLASGNYLLRSDSLKVYLYYDVANSVITMVDNLEDNVMPSFRDIEQVGDTILLYHNNYRTLYSFNEESLKFKVESTNFVDHYTRNLVVSDVPCTLTGSIDYDCLVIVGDSWALLEYTDTARFNGRDSIGSVVGDWFCFRVNSSNPSVYFNTKTKVFALVPTNAEICGNFIFNKVDSSTEIIDLVTKETLYTLDSVYGSVSDKGTFVSINMSDGFYFIDNETKALSDLISVGLSSVASSTHIASYTTEVVGEETKHYLDVLEISSNKTITFEMPNSIVLDSLIIVDNYIFVYINPITSGDEIGGFYAVNILNGDRVKVYSSNLVLSCVDLSINDVHFIASTSGTYVFNSTTLTLNKLSSSSSDRVIKSKDNLVLIGNIQDTSADYIVYDVLSDSFGYAFSAEGYGTMKIYQCEDYIITAYKHINSEGISCYCFARFDFKTFEIEILSDNYKAPYGVLPYSKFDSDYCCVQTVALESFVTVCINKGTGDILFYTGIGNASGVYASDTYALVKYESGEYVFFDFVNKEMSKIAKNTSLIQVNSVLLLIDNSSVGFYDLNSQKFCDLDSSYDYFSSYSLFKDVAGKLVFFSNTSVFELDKDTLQLIDTFTYFRYIESSESFKADVINTSDLYLGILYKWNNDTCSFDKYFVN